MSTIYYVDPDKNDANTGTSWANAKKTLGGALALVDDVITEEIIIKMKGSKTDPVIHTGGCAIKGITCIGDEAGLIIQSGDPGEGWSGWNATNYTNANGDPFDDTDGAGTWDPKSVKPVKLAVGLSIENSNNVLLRGLNFTSCEGGVGFVMLRGNSTALARYCTFDSQSSPGIMAAYGASAFVENCYFVGSCSPAVVALGNSQAHFHGNNYIEDVKYNGTITAAANSLVVFSPWEQNMSAFHTTEISTTTAAKREYAAIKALGGSTVVVDDGSLNLGNPIGAVVHIKNDSTVLHGQYNGVVLESRSLLTGAGNMIFTTLNAKGDAVDMPAGQQITGTSDQDATVVF